MNLKLVNTALVFTALLLMAANIRLRAISRPTGPPPSTQSKPARTTPINSVTNSDTAASATSAEKSGNAEVAQKRVQWAPLEAEEYSQYMANLRRYGFPKPLIRQIIIAEIDSLYAPRIDPLKEKPIPPDAPMSQRRRKPTPEDITRLRELQKALIEKEQQLASLGISSSREMIRTPNSRNWEAHEYAVSLLPPEKQSAARIIQENAWLQDDYNQSGAVDYTDGNKTELDAYRKMEEEKEAALKKILTPEEFERFLLNTMPQGTELARNTIGMEPTDDELMAMFRVYDDYWKKTGGVYGRWRAERVAQPDIKAADRELQQNLQQTLGADRYVDYQMATSDTGQQMNNLATRYDLSRETIRQAFATQAELDGLNQLSKRYFGGNEPVPVPQRAELQQKLQDTLGSIAFEAWQSGRNQKYTIDP